METDQEDNTIIFIVSKRRPDDDTSSTKKKKPKLRTTYTVMTNLSQLENAMSSKKIKVVHA